MSKTLFVGNLPFSMTEDGLRGLFEAVGPVVSTRIPLDRLTRKPRGFGFVEFEAPGVAQAAIIEFSGRRIDGRELVVNEARVREESRPGRR